MHLSRCRAEATPPTCPRKAEEIHRGSVSYKSDSCSVVSDGARVSISFNGLSLGQFSGTLQFTVYKGSNLLRQEAIAKTDEDSVAYIYKAGLKGFALRNDTRLVWRDTARQPQETGLGGAPNTKPVNLRARNRLLILDAGVGSLAVFPPPHKFFFARENEVNLGYVYYRKDSDSSFSLGAMQPEKGEGYPPWGVSDAEWKRRTGTARGRVDNFALYNAPPGNHAAHGGLLLLELARRSRDSGSCAGVYAQRHLQACARLQGPDRPLPPRLQ